MWHYPHLTNVVSDLLSNGSQRSSFLLHIKLQARRLSLTRLLIPLPLSQVPQSSNPHVSSPTFFPST